MPKSLYFMSTNTTISIFTPFLNIYYIKCFLQHFYVKLYIILISTKLCLLAYTVHFYLPAKTNLN